MASALIWLTLLVACSAVVGVPTGQTGLDDAMVTKVKANLAQIAIHRHVLASAITKFFLADAPASWEIGTQLETLLELEWRDLSVFGSAIPPPTTLASSDSATDVITRASE